MEEISSHIEDLDKVTKLIKVTIPPTSVEREYESSLTKLAQRVSVKGFRPGKAPRQLIAKSHADYLKSEIAEKLIGSSLDQIVKTNKLDLVGSPSIEGAVVEIGKALEYTAKVAIYPKPEVTGYDAFALKIGKRSPTEADLEQVIERMRDAKATLKKLEFRQAAQKGDVVDASLVTTVVGEKAARPEPLTAEIGKGQLPSELEEGLVGMSIGETKAITGKVPDNNRNDAIRGKEVEYKVTLNGLSERVLPEVSDDFTKTLDLDVQTVLELRMKVRTSLEEESERQAKVDAEAALLEELVTRNSFEVPQILIDEEIRALIARSGLVDPKTAHSIAIEAFREGLTEVALKRVRSAILVDRIAEIEKIKVEDEQIGKRIDEIALENNVTSEDVKKYLSQENRLLSLMLEMTRSKVISFLLERAKIEYFEKPKEEAGTEAKDQK